MVEVHVDVIADIAIGVNLPDMEVDPHIARLFRCRVSLLRHYRVLSVSKNGRPSGVVNRCRRDLPSVRACRGFASGTSRNPQKCPATEAYTVESR